MLSEERVRELAIRWYFLAILGQKESAIKAAPVFSKAHAFIAVLGLPSSISCGQKSEDGLKQYANILLNKWLEVEQKDDSPSVNEWLSDNVCIDFENQI